VVSLRVVALTWESGTSRTYKFVDEKIAEECSDTELASEPYSYSTPESEVKDRVEVDADADSI